MDTIKDKLRERLKKSVGHSANERSCQCDCIWCRDGGTFEQAVSDILALFLSLILVELPKELECPRHTNEPIVTCSTCRELAIRNQALTEVRQRITGLLGGE